MGFMAPLAIAGLAMAAAGTAYNFAEKRKTAKAVKRINEEASGRIDKNTAAATARWQESLAGLTPEEQERMAAEAADKRYAAFEEDTQDVPETTNVTGEGAPTVVKTEAAKQLGDQLAQMRGMMQARSRLGGWDDRGLQTGINLGRSRQEIGQYGNFSQGWASAAQQDAALRQQKHSPIGDILMGAGSLMSAGAGAAGMAGAGAATAATGAMGAANVVGPGGPSMWQQASLPMNTKWDLYGPPAPPKRF